MASTPTASRVWAGIDTDRLVAVRQAQAAAREVVWTQAAETGQPVLAARAGGRDIPDLVIDLDASLAICHSEKENTAPTFKHSYGYHPLFGFLDNTGEALAAVLRAGNAGSNTAADHITVLDACLAQIHEPQRYGTPILIRADTAGCTKDFLTHIRSPRKHGINIWFTIGAAITSPLRERLAWLVDQPEL